MSGQNDRPQFILQRPSAKSEVLHTVRYLTFCPIFTAPPSLIVCQVLLTCTYTSQPWSLRLQNQQSPNLSNLTDENCGTCHSARSVRTEANWKVSYLWGLWQYQSCRSGTLWRVLLCWKPCGSGLSVLSCTSLAPHSTKDRLDRSRCLPGVLAVQSSEYLTLREGYLDESSLGSTDPKPYSPYSSFCCLEWDGGAPCSLTFLYVRLICRDCCVSGVICLCSTTMHPRLLRSWQHNEAKLRP